MDEIRTLVELVGKKEKMVCMLAPSFPVMFSYPAIVTMLRKLGFSYVVEVAVGAKKTNEQLQALLKANPNGRYITSPCPTVVRMVKKIMPEYAKYFTQGVDSPMIATAKICKEKYPDFRPVFIGPCILKKMEAKEDAPWLNILVLTYLDMLEVFNHFGITEQADVNDHFDISEPGETLKYPMDGGLAQSSGLTKQLPVDEVKIVSAAGNIEAIKEFDTNTKIKILDILNCPGGCISGPGIKSNLTVEERRKKILDYYLSRLANSGNKS